jgi:hypothetical protein
VTNDKTTEALQEQIATLLRVPAVRAHLRDEAERAEHARAEAEREAAYRQTNEYKALQAQAEREATERAH